MAVKNDDPEQKVHFFIQHEIQIENFQTPRYMSILLISNSEKARLNIFSGVKY